MDDGEWIMFMATTLDCGLVATLLVELIDYLLLLNCSVVALLTNYVLAINHMITNEMVFFVRGLWSVTHKNIRSK